MIKSKYSFLIISCIIFSFFSVRSYSQETNWFTDITHSVGLDSVRTSKIQSVDINGDNYPDLLVGTGGLIPGNSNTFTLFLNVPDENNPNSRKYVDFTEESGINVNRDPNKSYREYDVAIMADIDNDGDPDLVTSFYYHRLEWFKPGHEDRSEVYLNDGTGHFTLKKDAGLYHHLYSAMLDSGMIDAVGLSFIDYDYDGILDLYIATKFIDYKNSVYFPDVLMKGNGDGSFTEIKNNGVHNIPEPLYGVNVTDYNNDGWQDVITSPYCRTGGRLLENQKDGTFKDVERSVNYSSQHNGGDWYYDQNNKVWRQQPLCQWEAPAADFDNDGDMDLLQCLIHGGLEARDGVREGHTHIAINQGPPNYNFVDDLDIIHRVEDKRSHLGDYSGLWVDFDNNAWLDLIVCQGHYTPTTDRVYMCMQRDDHQFYDVSKELGLLNLKDGVSSESCDFDLDGDNDIFVCHNVNGKAELHLLRNDRGNSSNWISVKLTNPPSGCNRDAIGARITVCSDTIKQIREIQTGLGHFGGQEPFIRNFGLGDMNRVDSIIVRLPMKGIPTTVVYNPPTNIIIQIDSNGLNGFVKTWKGKQAIVKFVQTYTDFGTINVGDSVEAVFEITNVGDTTLNVSDFAINNDDFNVFQIVNKEVPFSLEPNETKQITIRFIPKRRESYKSIITFNSNAINDTTKSYDIYGAGYEPSALIALSQVKISFDSTKTTSEKPLIIKNVGELDLNISDMSITQDSNQVFSIKENLQFPVTIKTKDSLIINLVFSPKIRVNYSANLIINSDAYNNPSEAIELFGIGNAPTPLAKFNKQFLNFGTVHIGESKDVEFKIDNQGDGNLIVNNIYVDENEDSVYSIISDELPIMILPDSSQKVVLHFEPKEQKSYNRDLFVISNAFNEPEKKLIIRGKGGEPIFVEDSYYDNSIALTVSPNPVFDIFKLQINNLQNISTTIKIDIVNLQGIKVMDIFNGNLEQSSEKNIDINSSLLPKGIYFITAVYGSKRIVIPIVKL